MALSRMYWRVPVAAAWCVVPICRALWAERVMLSRVKFPLLWTPSGSWASERAMGLGMRWNCSRPMFIALSVAPMEKMETMTPIMRATCCFHGVAPMR